MGEGWEGGILVIRMTYQDYFKTVTLVVKNYIAIVVTFLRGKRTVSREGGNLADISKNSFLS